MATYQKRGKSYTIRSSCGYDINGKQIIHSMTWSPEKNMTPKQEEKELRRQMVLFDEKCKNNQYMDNSIRFKDFVDLWLKEYAKKQLKAKTLKGYYQYLARILPALGHIKISKLQPFHLMQFYDNLAEEGIRLDTKYQALDCLNTLIYNLKMTKTAFAKMANVSITTLNQAIKKQNVNLESAIRISKALDLNIKDVFIMNSSKTTLSGKMILHHHRLISSILQTAVHWQVIPFNPCDRVKAPKIEHKESRYLDDTEVIRMFEYLEKESIQHQAIIYLFVYSGMRRGELCGLKWSDLDFDNKLIKIQREVLYLPEIGIYEDTTKTFSSQRIIKIADIVFSLLNEHRKGQILNRLKCGDQWQEGDYIFTQWNGRPIHPDSITSWFHRFILKNDLPYASIHSLRHSHATIF